MRRDDVGLALLCVICVRERGPVPAVNIFLMLIHSRHESSPQLLATFASIVTHGDRLAWKAGKGC